MRFSLLPQWISTFDSSEISAFAYSSDRGKIHNSLRQFDCEMRKYSTVPFYTSIKFFFRNYVTDKSLGICYILISLYC